MDPTSPQSLPPNPYDFITNPAQPPKKTLLPGGSLRTRLLIIVGGAVALMGIIAIITVLFTGGGKGNTAALKELVAQQRELARIADIGAQRAQDGSTRSLALVTKLSLTTQQQQLTSYLEDRGNDIKREELEAKKNPKTDQTLEAAASASRFDDALRSELETQLRAYLQSLQSVHQDISNDTGKSILARSYESTSAILGPDGS